MLRSKILLLFIISSTNMTFTDFSAREMKFFRKLLIRYFGIF